MYELITYLFPILTEPDAPAIILMLFFYGLGMYMFGRMCENMRNHPDDYLD